MRRFIEAMVGVDGLDIGYGDYDTLFVKLEYDSYYYFFFLKEKEQLSNLQSEAEDIFHQLKESKIYQPDMDKNTTCIFCLRIEEDEYYKIEKDEEISEISKIICLIEEDLNYFKKNVFLYTDKMEQFAQKNIGKFELLCEEYFTEESFREYKKSNKDSFEYDFLINMFIKIPFLSFYEYQKKKDIKYQTAESFIEKRCAAMEIDLELINKLSMDLEKLEDEDALYKWVDTLIEQRNSNDKGVLEVINNED